MSLKVRVVARYSVMNLPKIKLSYFLFTSFKRQIPGTFYTECKYRRVYAHLHIEKYSNKEEKLRGLLEKLQYNYKIIQKNCTANIT